MKRTIAPRKSILDPTFVYRNAAQTNVMETWKRHGFVPPEEQRRAKQLRAANRAEMRGKPAARPIPLRALEGGKR